MKTKASSRVPSFSTSVDIDVDIDPDDLHDAGWHHESECGIDTSDEEDRASLTLPNDQELQPGEKAQIWYYDAAPVPGVPAGWRLAGTGTVSADGARVVSAPGVGIARFCGVWATSE